MRFERIELFNWDIQANQAMVLEDGVNLLTGENGSGKTSILDAIKVALGATRLGTDRSYEVYLRRRGAPFSMVRLVASNTPDPETQLRPFGRLGAYVQDHVTLAVVFEAGDEGYSPKWYILDGDRSPLASGPRPRHFQRKRDYLDRLAVLGMGPSFQRLLCTPQGEIASLCRLKPSELFDLLYDFIGGREVLDEWQALRAQFDRERRTREDRAAALRERQNELDRLSERLEHHQRYLKRLKRVQRYEQALPWARARQAGRQVEDLEARRAELVQTAHEAGSRSASATARANGLEEQDQALEERQTGLKARERERDQAEQALQDERAEVRATFLELDRLRKDVAGLSERDLATLETERDSLLETQAETRVEARSLRGQLAMLADERERLDQGLLTPPQGVDGFREVLQRADIPHHLLMDLLEPQVQDEATRRALESYLGDLRFAVAVPDLNSFAKAVALARAHRFPFYVLAPDVRSNPPRTGVHPFLAAVQVLDPRYRGLVRRVLRHVDWLEGEITTSFRARGARVDGAGFVLDRTGGRYQGTDDWYLGREALARRRAALEKEVSLLKAQLQALREEDLVAGNRLTVLGAWILEERRRLRWLAARTTHAHLRERLRDLDERITGQRSLAEALQQEREDLDGQRRRLVFQLGTQRKEAQERREEQRRALSSLEALSTARNKADHELAQARAKLPSDSDQPPQDLVGLVDRPPAGLAGDLEREQADLSDYSDADRDLNLPGNVRTLERQVHDVRGELERLDGQLDLAREQAERAHSQYQTVTRRVFRTYFKLLRNSGIRLGMTLEGKLRPRDDGRFDVELQAGVGDKSPVSYSSADLSGGQKAALSILMGMSTLQIHHGDQAAGFFLVDEPFSASDTYKIQELGAFLERTGAQYIVSMPTSSDLRSCGAWLRAALTCTQTRGGTDEHGELILAPPVKCSYVVRNGG
jgi:chromosome segregation ATPase